MPDGRQKEQTTHPAELLVGVGVNSGDAQQALGRLAQLLELGGQLLAVAAPGRGEVPGVSRDKSVDRPPGRIQGCAVQLEPERGDNRELCSHQGA